MLTTDAFGQVCYDCGLTSATGCATISSTDTCQFAASGGTTSAHYATAFSNGRATADSSFAASGGVASGSGSTGVSGGSALGEGSFCAVLGSSQGSYAVAMGDGSAVGDFTVAIGERSIAWELGAIVIGNGSSIYDTLSLGIGHNNLIYGENSMAFGERVSTTSGTDFSFVFGHGLTSGRLENGISNSMMLGMNSDVPTVFIQDAGGYSGAFGRVGIGTTDPDGLLHLKDESEDNTFMIFEKADTVQGGIIWHNGAQAEGTVNASLLFDASENLRVRNAVSDQDIIFNINDGGTDTEVMRIEGNDAFVGIGISNATGKLHVQDRVDSGREILARFSVRDAFGDILNIRNASTTDGEFEPEITGWARSHSGSGLKLTAETESDGVSDTEPVMVFTSRLFANPPDTLSNRPLFEWRNAWSTKMHMDADGNLGIGTTSPSGRLEVAGTTFINTLPVAGGTPIGYDANNQLVDISGSSQHFKEQIEELEFNQEQFLSMRPVSFNWKAAYGGGEDVGFIAQEVAQDFPPLADIRYKHTYLADGLILRDTLGLPVLDSTQTEPYGVKYHKLPVYLYMLAKQQDSTITELTNRVDELQAMVESCCAQPAYRMSDEAATETQQPTNSMKNEFVLLQNDPNPFTDYTDIRISMPESATNVSLLIVDMKGSVMLNTPVNGISETIRVYSSDIGKGIFTYYLLSEGNVIASRKMVSSK